MPRSKSDPLADRKSAERWLATFPSSDPLALHAQLIDALAQTAQQAARRTPARLEAVLACDTGTLKMRKALSAQYLQHASRSSKIEQQLWSALFELTQAFLVAYAAFARDVGDYTQNGRWKGLAPQLLCQQVVHLGLDARIRLYRYEQWIPAKWAELHGLFTLACARQVERIPIPRGRDGITTTIEQEYVQVLVLQLMNSGNLTARHLEWIANELDEWCAPLRLTLEPASVNSFYVDLGSREGLRRRSPAPLEGRVLFLDTRSLHSVLMQNVLVLDQKIRAQPLSDKTPRRSEQLSLLNKIAAQVDPEFKPFARRGERTAADGTVDAIVGFTRIAGYLREEESNPLPQVDVGNSFDNTMDIAVFGRMRNQRDRQIETSRRRLAQYATAGGPWEVKDVSQTGFRLVAPMSDAHAVTLGTMAAIRPHGQPLWTLGIVRRMKRITSDRAEIGLQVIATTIVGVELIDQRKSVEDDYSVDGEAITINGRRFPALYLALRKRDADTPVRSLVLPASEYQPMRRFKLSTSKSTYPVRFGRLIEQQPDWVWTAVEPLDVGSSDVGGSNTVFGDKNV
ncbi:MAG TPA: hypothetical protein VMV45_15560 [Casimicrobiaceae bacterium]|nr:hypothetical protein [Casimicrobiaceae bacterium]